MAKILVLPSEVVGESESGNSYAFPADNILMSDKTTTVEEAIDNKPGEKTTEGGEIFNNYDQNRASGDYAHAEGNNTIASGDASHTEGYSTEAYGRYSHAEGFKTNASAYYSHAEGNATTASSTGSHSEGTGTTASGNGSHAEGGETTASGIYSHAEGYDAEASGSYSHAEGYHTLASSNYQHVQGKYNVEDSSGAYAHIVGWGTGESSRANIHTITTTGDGWFSGTVEGASGFKIDDYLFERLNTVSAGTGGSEAGSYLSLKNGGNSICSIDGNGNANFVGKVTVGTDSTEITPTDDNDLVTKKYVDASGVGRKTDSGGEVFNSATDANMDAHAEGAETTASGMMSHSEGNLTTASGNISHAEGTNTKAQGTGAHAEGQQTSAVGDYSHAEGNDTTASGDYSHSEGAGTIAASESQHVQGKYNVEDSSGAYAHIVGWGTSDSDRKNIHTIDTSGNGWFSGTIEGENGVKVGSAIITFDEDSQMIAFNFN